MHPALSTLSQVLLLSTSLWWIRTSIWFIIWLVAEAMWLHLESPVCTSGRGSEDSYTTVSRYAHCQQARSEMCGVTVATVNTKLLLMDVFAYQWKSFWIRAFGELNIMYVFMLSWHKTSGFFFKCKFVEQVSTSCLLLRVLGMRTLSPWWSPQGPALGSRITVVWHTSFCSYRRAQYYFTSVYQSNILIINSLLSSLCLHTHCIPLFSV